MRHASFCFATLLLLSLLCRAQDGSTGAVRGMVLDALGGRIAGATIALVNDSTAFHYQQTTKTQCGPIQARSRSTLKILDRESGCRIPSAISGR
jgi:hypothetical protein